MKGSLIGYIKSPLPWNIIIRTAKEYTDYRRKSPAALFVPNTNMEMDGNLIKQFDEVKCTTVAHVRKQLETAVNRTKSSNENK